MKKLFLLMVALFLLTSTTAFAFVSDFEGEDDTVYIAERYTGVDFPFVDGWMGRISRSDSKPIDVFNAELGENAGEGTHSFGFTFYDPTDTGATIWDVNNRDDDKFADIVQGDSFIVHVWIPADEGFIDTLVEVAPYYQYGEWSEWVDTVVTLAELYDAGFEEGGWARFALELAADGASMDAMGVEYHYPDTVNPDDTWYIDYIYNKEVSGVPVSEGVNVLTLPSASMNGLKYEISSAALIHIDVYNISGQKVKEIVPGAQSAGSYSLDVDVAPGVYLYKVTANKESKGSKLIILQ
jgi:hypothetical protein